MSIGLPWSGPASRFWPSSCNGLLAIFLKCTKLIMASGSLQICFAIVSLPLNLCMVLCLPCLSGTKSNVPLQELPCPTDLKYQRAPPPSLYVDFSSEWVLIWVSLSRMWTLSKEELCNFFVPYCMHILLLAHTSIFVNQNTDAPSGWTDLQKRVPTSPWAKAELAEPGHLDFSSYSCSTMAWNTVDGG